MKLSYSIPENKKEISVVKFLEIEKIYNDAQDNETEVNEKKIVSVCLDIPYHYVDKLPFEEYQLAVNSISKALSSESTFYQRFEYKGIEFGFIPDLEKITAGEFAALEGFFKDPSKNALSILSLLYKPIKEEKEYSNWWSKEKVKKYTVETYDENVDVSFYKDVPYEIYEGAIVFFYNLGKHLLVATQRCMNQVEAKMTKQEHLEKSGDGIKHLTHTLNQQMSQLKMFTKNLQVQYYLD